MGNLFSTKNEIKKEFILEENIINEEEEEKGIIKTTRMPLALCYSYLGTNLHGLSFNPHNKTIEYYLFQALEKNHLIEKSSSRSLGVLHWSQASRTDSGVHACAQILTFLVMLPPKTKIKDLSEIIQNSIPKEIPIKIWKSIMPNRTFNAQKYADSRIYQYLIPLNAFKYQTIEHINFLNNEILKIFLGEKNYHNYTKKVDKFSRSSNRFIIKFEISNILNLNNENYVLFLIHGKSFMINQIRKMIAIILSISFEQININELIDTFTLSKWEIPKVPGIGLYLDKVEYNSSPIVRKYGINNVPPDKDIHFTNIRSNIENWKKNILFPHIIEIYQKENIFQNWINNILLNFPPKKI